MHDSRPVSVRFTIVFREGQVYTERTLSPICSIVAVSANGFVLAVLLGCTALIRTFWIMNYLIIR